MESAPGRRVWAENDLLPLSGLQHVVFCERQFALIHVEQVWSENALTVEGTHLHEQVDGGEAEARGDVRIARAVPLRSLTLGLSGRSDVVELRRDADGAEIPGVPGRWRPYPIEYKRGRPKPHRADEVQLCAQALCLEEMLELEVPRGALFYGQVRRRTEVFFDQELRAAVVVAAQRARSIFESRVTPTARREAKCEHCSLLEACQPSVVNRSAERYVESLRREVLRDDAEGRAR